MAATNPSLGRNNILGLCWGITYFISGKARFKNVNSNIWIQLFLDRHPVCRSLDPTLDIWSNFVTEKKSI